MNDENATFDSKLTDKIN